MTTSFARRMERKAHDIAELMESVTRADDRVPIWNREVNGRSNVKPFYSPLANLNKDSCRVVLIGDNPGGNPKPPDDTTGPRYEQFLEMPRGEYNAFVHEKWGQHKEGMAPMQLAVQQVFQVLFGAARWYKELLNSVSFNVCPLRTRKTDDIPCAVWVRCEAWPNRILDVLEPELILCCGNSDDYKGNIGNSPWAMMRRRLDFDEDSVDGWTSKGISLKRGRFDTGPLRGASVVGMRHLSSQKTVKTTIDLLRDNLPDIGVPRSDSD